MYHAASLWTSYRLCTVYGSAHPSNFSTPIYPGNMPMSEGPRSPHFKHCLPMLYVIFCRNLWNTTIYFIFHSNIPFWKLILSPCFRWLFLLIFSCFKHTSEEHAHKETERYTLNVRLNYHDSNTSTYCMCMVTDLQQRRTKRGLKGLTPRKNIFKIQNAFKNSRFCNALYKFYNFIPPVLIQHLICSVCNQKC